MRHRSRSGKRYFVRYLPLVWVITLLLGFGLAALQQTIRLSANQPQLQMATDLTAALSVGEDPAPLIPPRSIDIALSLSPFVIIYNESGQPLLTSVVGFDKLPAMPKGVFDYARSHTDNRITWQPRQDIRVAAVIQHYKTNDGKSGFVLIGRNLREVEHLEAYILKLAALTWAVTIIGMFVLIAITEKPKIHA